ncbi:hypothetical protein ACGV4K_18090 [Streptomyces sp. WAC8370]|uniref:hypothetical protein n=1 Tax=Streptomyces TaxID=1883 RepID=UPI001FE7ABA5|nr:hypothetical protein [Streptomyces ardesiacus]
MRIRRFLAVAAATAVTAPVALLVAPAAHATDDSPSPTVSETAPSQEESTPAADDTSAAADDTTPATDESTPADDESTPAAGDPAAPGTSPSATVSASPSASASAPASGPAECSEEDVTFDDDLHTGLSGLPSEIVAGSGFHGFKLTVDNKGDKAYHRVDLGVFAARIDENDFFVDTGHLTLQYKDPATGAWTDISLAQDDEGAGYLGYTDVRAKESFSVDLRLAVDAKAPSGLGFAISIGVYADDEGNCVFSGDDGYYEFDILAAGTTPADTGDAKPQGGSKPLPVKPVGDTRIDPQGRLAATGSSSALPALALAGGAAVALGVGTMFVVRRRRTTGSGATA